MALRRQHRIYPQISRATGVAISTISRMLRAAWRDRQADRSRRAGWDYVHVAIDDHSRIAHARIQLNEKRPAPECALSRRTHRQRCLYIDYTDSSGPAVDSDGR